MLNPLRFLWFMGLKVAVCAELRVCYRFRSDYLSAMEDVRGLMRRACMYEDYPLQENYWH